MNSRSATPGLVIGFLSLMTGVVSYLAPNADLFAPVAGLLGLAAGVSGLRLAQHLNEQAAVQRLVEEELRAVRSESQETEERLRNEISAIPYEDVPFEESSDTLTDGSTGLFSESFFNVAIESRIAAARRHLRPVAVVLLEVVEGLPDGDPSEANANIVADAVKITLREADTACRLRNGYFALLLEDTPENGAIWTVERIRRQLLGAKAGMTLWAGVACYPAHAFSTEEIMSAADHALEMAREWRQDRIEVAVAAAD